MKDLERGVRFRRAPALWAMLGLALWIGFLFGAEPIWASGTASPWSGFAMSVVWILPGSIIGWIVATALQLRNWKSTVKRVSLLATALNVGAFLIASVLSLFLLAHFYPHAPSAHVDWFSPHLGWSWYLTDVGGHILEMAAFGLLMTEIIVLITRASHQTRDGIS